MDKTSYPDARTKTLPRFWMGSLVAGCCFALGYGIADRVLTLQVNVEDPASEAFVPLAFPGDSLQEIRARFSDDDPSLHGDVPGLESAEATSRPAKPAVKTSPKPELALQAPDPQVWMAPSWSDPETISPDLLEEDAAAPSAADEPEPVVLPPGAEAFFEVIEPVTPPQP